MSYNHIHQLLGLFSVLLESFVGNACLCPYLEGNYVFVYQFQSLRSYIKAFHSAPDTVVQAHNLSPCKVLTGESEVQIQFLSYRISLKPAQATKDIV